MCIRDSVPSGYLECKGAAISRTDFSALFAIISDDFGPGNGSSTFNLPDLRGEFIRGWDHGAGNDPDVASRTDRGDGVTDDRIGTKQSDEIKSHNHAHHLQSIRCLNNSGTGIFSIAQDTTAGTTQSTGGNETRPRNVYMMYIIKF